MADFHNLKVWRKGHELSLEVSRVCTRSKGRMSRNLRSQMVRAAESIPTNIVEGSAMNGDREFARFVGYSIASCSELEYHLLSARDKGILSRPDYSMLTGRVHEERRMLYGFLRVLQQPTQREAPTTAATRRHSTGRRAGKMLKTES